jgi:hypothetical protein
MAIARPAAFAIAAAFAFAPAVAAKPAQPQVNGAWVRLPAVAGRPAGGYFTAKGGGAADALVAVSSPAAKSIELHSMTMTDGVMKMRAETSFAVPATGELKLAPGGNHLMIFGLSPDVKAGTKVPLTFTFQSGAKVTVDAEARPATADGMAPGQGHQH